MQNLTGQIARAYACRQPSSGVCQVVVNASADLSEPWEALQTLSAAKPILDRLASQLLDSCLLPIATSHAATAQVAHGNGHTSFTAELLTESLHGACEGALKQLFDFLSGILPPSNP